MSAGPRTELLGIPLEKALGWYRPICCDSSTSPCLGVMAVLGAFTWDTGPAHRFQPWPWLVTWPWESAVVSYWDVLLSSSSLFLTILSIRISWETVKLLSKVMALSQSIHLIFWFSGSNIMTTLCHGHWPLGSPFLCAGQPFVWFSAPEFCPWSTWGSTAFSLSNSHFFFFKYRVLASSILSDSSQHPETSEVLSTPYQGLLVLSPWFSFLSYQEGARWEGHLSSRHGQRARVHSQLWQHWKEMGKMLSLAEKGLCETDTWHLPKSWAEETASMALPEGPLVMHHSLQPWASSRK